MQVRTANQLRRIDRAFQDLVTSFESTNFWVPLHEAQIVKTHVDDLIEMLRNESTE